MRQESFWVQREKASYPALRGRCSADAVVIGGGVTGVTTALWLSRAGLRVRLLEADTLCGGASSRCCGIVSLANAPGYAAILRRWGLERAAAYARTQQNALHTLRSLARLEGMDPGWQDTDAQLVAQGEREARQLQAEAEAMRRVGIPAEETRSTQCPLPADAAITLRGMATLDPARLVRRMAAQAVSKGLKIHEQSRVISLETNIVCTERGSVQAPYIVVATGYPIVNVPGWYFLRLRQRQSWLVPLADTVRFSGAYMERRYALRRFREGALLQVNGRYAGARGQRREREQALRTWLPLMGADTPDGVYGGLETWSDDGIPYIGAYSPKTPNLFVAAGFNGRGLLFSMVAAQAISARVLGLPCEEYQVYAASRHALPVSRHTFSMAGVYVKDYLLHPAAPRCPHLGCKLRRDEEKNLWVCPCHGSQFDTVGHLRNAPAVHDAQLHKRGGG